MKFVKNWILICPGNKWKRPIYIIPLFDYHPIYIDDVAREFHYFQIITQARKRGDGLQNRKIIATALSRLWEGSMSDGNLPTLFWVGGRSKPLLFVYSKAKNLHANKCLASPAEGTFYDGPWNYFPHQHRLPSRPTRRRRDRRLILHLLEPSRHRRLC